MSGQIPDTLTLEERAREALNAVLGVADPDYEYIPFFSGNLLARPAWMSHGNWDFGSSHGRLVDAAVLARHMIGEKEPSDVERHYRENLLSFFREDGLNYRRNSFSSDPYPKYQARFVESASMIDQRSVLLGLTTWYLETGDEKVKEFADRHCAALKRIARKERDSWYYPASEYTINGWPSLDAVHTRLAVDPAAMWGRQVMPLIRYHAITGNPDALELAENFTANITSRSGVFNKDGSFNDALIYRNGHFHTRMGTLAALARFAAYTDNAALLNWVKRPYDWALSRCTAFGWTPGDMRDQAYEHETCTLADAIETGITLARAGYVEYWSIVERFVRNHLTEAQLLDIDWIEECDDKSRDVPRKRTHYKVATRLRGAFAGYAAPNDFVYTGQKGRGHVMDVQTCCIGAGIRGLHAAWNNAVTVSRGTVRVNLLLNRCHPLLQILSYLPYEGRLELMVSAGIKDLRLRIPEWVPYGAVTVERKRGEEVRRATGRELGWVETYYLRLGEATAGEKITVTFPCREHSTMEMAVDDGYLTSWRGDNVSGIEPPGENYPLYSQREYKGPCPQRSGVLICRGESPYA